MPWNQTNVRASGYTVTAAVWNDELVENMQFLEEVDYVQITSNVTVSATTAATANTVVTGTSQTYEAVPHWVEFFAPSYAVPSGATMNIMLWDQSTDLGRLAGLVAGTGADNTSGVLAYRWTPTAATHEPIIKAYRVTSNCTIVAGAGGTDTYLPAFIRVTRIPT